MPIRDFSTQTLDQGNITMRRNIKGWLFILGTTGCSYDRDVNRCDQPPDGGRGSGQVSSQAGSDSKANAGAQVVSGSGGASPQASGSGASGEGHGPNTGAGNGGQAGELGEPGLQGVVSTAGAPAQAGSQNAAGNGGDVVALIGAGRAGEQGVAGGTQGGAMVAQEGTAGCAATTERCDGIDNDCDGMIDYVEKAWGYSSVCDCKDTKLSVSKIERDDDTNHTGCTTGYCGWDADGVSPWMAFCCDAKGAWSQCRFSPVDLNAFDADNGGRGALEVVVELAGSVRGLGLSLWYGDYPKRKKLVILDGKEGATIGPGRITRVFSSEDAQCPAYEANVLNDPAFKDFPRNCVAGDPAWVCDKGRWAQLSAECAFDYGASTMYLTAEHCSAEVRSSASIVSVRYVGDMRGCTCQSDLGCRQGQSCDSTTAVPAPWCDSQNPSCAGVCTDPVADVAPCSGMVGLYADGTAIPGSTSAFTAACLPHWPELGVPIDNGGSQYVHEVCDSAVEVQDFLQADAAKAISRDGRSILIRNSGLDEAFMLYGDFWLAYVCSRTTDGCTTGMGGSSLLGPPTDEKHMVDGMIRQNFDKGWMTLDENGSCVTVHLNQHRDPAEYSYDCPEDFCVKTLSP
jgi:hypothetical protein